MPASERFLSPSWYRVSALKPRLREHVTVRMHRYRGQLWYVIGDGLRNRVHRLSPAAYVIVASMDGTRTLDTLWSEAAVALGEEAPSQNQVISLLGQLHTNDLIAGDVPPDVRELFERQQKTNRSKLLQWLMNPLAPRIPLVDPNNFLTATLPYVRPLLGRLGGVLWLATVLPALLLAIRYWPELTQNVSDRVLPVGNLLLIIAVYPVIKLLHELGHGYMTKAHGGEVHELGVMLLVLLPMPYVEVSAAAGFRSKWTRCAVGAAGVMVELFIAALALCVWLLVEPGLVRALAFNVMLTASVSSVLFNGNPLLRYDGYYVLADAVEVPNLALRGRQYWLHLLRRYIFRLRNLTDFPSTRGERIWFLLYIPVAVAYRLSVTIGIALFLMGRYHAAGVALALWGIGAGVAAPAVRGVWSLISSPDYARNRVRVLTLTAAAAAAVLLLLDVPLPLHTVAEGIVWLPDDAIVRAGADGFVTAVDAAPGDGVLRGQVLVESVDPELAAKVKSLRAQEAGLLVKLDAVRFTDRVEAIVTEAELKAVRTELALAEHQTALLRTRAGDSGIFAMADPADMPGRYFKRGDVLGYVVPVTGARLVRATVAQENIDLVRNHVHDARIMLTDHLNRRPLDVVSVREVPAGNDKLPSAALGSLGGGDTATDPKDDKGMTTLNRVFQFDLRLAAPVMHAGFGSRAYVRFDHDWEPLGEQLWRRARQLLLSRVEF
jgi:putative peptide zinc metalloprotease protein